MFNQALHFRRAVMALATAACASLASAAGTCMSNSNTAATGSSGYRHPAQQLAAGRGEHLCQPEQLRQLG
jgi:hypothetical protein